MTAKTKKVIKIVGISSAILLIIGTGIYIYYRSTHQTDDNDENLYDSIPKSSNSSSYSSDEIINMQAWLLSIAIKNDNQLIIDAIQTTGGVDGYIGTGFNTALAEAIKQGYVTSLNDLYHKSN